MGTAIRTGDSYAISDFMRLTGLGSKAIREAERNGLRCSFVGIQKFITGDEWLKYLAAQADKPPPYRGQRNAGEPKQVRTPRGCVKESVPA